jgi:hypothetical protein
LAEPAGRSVAARTQSAADKTPKIDITQTADNELFVRFFMAASVSPLESDAQELCSFALS